MNIEKPTVLMTAVLVVVAATAFATDSAFAQDNQAASEVNECGNGASPINAFCQDLTSLLQGDNNDVYILGEQEASSKIVTEEEATEEETEEETEDAEFE